VKVSFKYVALPAIPTLPTSWSSHPVGNTSNICPLLLKPATVIRTLPVVAPEGTATTTLVLLQEVGVAAVPLNVRVLVPCVVPNPVPVIVIVVPTNPLGGDMLVMLGRTEKLAPLLDDVPTVTTTFPSLAAVGTGTTMLVELQLVGVPAVPLNVTVLDPCVAPKFDPLMVTAVPVVPKDGESAVIDGTVTAK